MKIAALIFLTLITLMSCDDFLEKNISDESVILKSPVRGFETTDTIVNFKWDGIEGAKWYEFELITPSFDSVYKYVLDSILEGQELTLILPTDQYAWGVKAANNSFETNFTIDSFRIIGVLLLDVNKISVQLHNPINNFVSNENFVEFNWEKNENIDKYSFVIKRNSWADSIYFDETTSKNFSKILLNDGIYYWGVAALDFEKDPVIIGEYSVSSLVVNYLAPEYPKVVAPSSSDTIKSHYVKFEWNIVEDSSNYNLVIFKNSTLTDIYSDEWVTDTVKSTLINLDGNVYWKIRTKDRYGKIGAFSPVNNFFIKTDKNISNNIVNILSPQQNSVITDSTITFWWDVINGATQYQLQIVTPNFTSAQKLVEDVSIENNSYKSKLPAGAYQWRVKGYNSEFETSYSNGAFSVYQSNIEDKTVNLILPNNGELFNKGLVNFSWESMSNCNYILQIRSGAWEGGTIIKNVELNSSTYEVNLNNGIYFWGIQAIDTRNGVKTDFTVRNFNVDLVKPEIPTLITPANGYETSEMQVEFSWEGQDDDISFYTFEIYKQTNVLALVSAKTLTKASILYNFDSSGSYSWRVKATDKANNESDFSSFMTLSILGETSISNEYVQLLSPSNGALFTASNIVLWWDAVDYAKQYKLQVVSPSFNSSQRLITSTVLEETSYELELSSGKYEWRVKAINNISETPYATGNFSVQNVDISNKFVELYAPENNLLTNSTKIAFSWRKVNEYCSYNLIIKKDSWDNGSIVGQFNISDTTKTINLNDGIYYWGIKAISSDKSETTVSVRSITIDTDSPLIPLITSPINQTETYDKNVQFSWEPASSNDPILKYTIEIYYTINSKNSLIYTYNTSQRQMTYHFSLPGDYFWRIKAMDNAGNSSEYSSNFYFTVLIDFNLSSSSVTLLSPANNLNTDLTEVTFWWEEIDGTDQYVFQLIRPSFSTPEELVSDVKIGENKITLSLPKRGSYQWRVKAINSSSETGYATRSLILY